MKKGFTLIELLMVIVIIGVLMGLAIPALLSARESAKKQRRTTERETITAAAWAYKHEYGRWPTDELPDPNDSTTWTNEIPHPVFKLYLDPPATTTDEEKYNPRDIRFMNWSDFMTEGSHDDFRILDPVNRQPYSIVVDFAEDTLWVTNMPDN